jgi:hypothetical protein
MRRRLGFVLVLVLAAASPAAAKDGAQAHLLAPLPSHPAPGTFINVRWTVDVPGADGKRVAFAAIGMLVTLRGSNGASAVATAPQTHGPPYSARIRVPLGGIRAIRFGLRGYSTLHRTANIFFPLR